MIRQSCARTGRSILWCSEVESEMWWNERVVWDEKCENFLTFAWNIKKKTLRVWQIFLKKNSMEYSLCWDIFVQSQKRQLFFGFYLFTSLTIALAWNYFQNMKMTWNK